MDLGIRRWREMGVPLIPLLGKKKKERKKAYKMQEGMTPLRKKG